MMGQDLVESASRAIEAEVPRRERQLDELAESIQQSVREGVRAGGEPARTAKDWLHGVWLGHSLHTALSDVPIGAWALSAILDLVGSRRGADTALLVGVVAAVPTALAGAADWSDTEGKARRYGLAHAVLNSLSLGCFTTSLLARKAGKRSLGIGLSTTGLALGTMSAYLGGEMVYKLGAAVSRTAFRPDPAPSSFKVAMKAADLPEGKLTAAEITVDGQKVPLVLLKRGAEVLALDGTCSHWGAPLAEGTIVGAGDCVECPWHASTFNMRDGSVVHGPATTRQPAYETRVQFGNVEVRRRA